MSRWEAQLKSEGLGPIDYEVAGVVMMGGGGGKLKMGHDFDAAGQAEARAQQETKLDAARDVLRSHRFPAARDRRIWVLHAEGIGTREIAAQLHHDRRTVRASIAATTLATHRRATRHVDPRREIRKEVASTPTLVALLRVLGR